MYILFHCRPVCKAKTTSFFPKYNFGAQSTFIQSSESKKKKNGGYLIYTKYIVSSTVWVPKFPNLYKKQTKNGGHTLIKKNSFIESLSSKLGFINNNVLLVLFELVIYVRYPAPPSLEKTAMVPASSGIQ